MQLSLLEISARHSPSSFTSRLVSIQSSRMTQAKSLDFIRNLERLYFEKASNRRRYDSKEIEAASRPALLREKINAFDERNYVALSYTWDASPYEIKAGVDSDVVGFIVQQWDGEVREPEPSPVRNVVFDRMKRYINYVGADYLWIDRHCMQAMDLIYGLSLYPVALLTRRVESSEELQLLVQILRGELVEDSPGKYTLAKGLSIKQALKAVHVLRDITSDLWWTRGWTYQEDYRASTRMTLLLPHLASLENEKPYMVKPTRRKYVMLGRLPGELCINSVTFHDEATKLCLAYQNQKPLGSAICKSILERAGKYTALLQVQDEDGDMVAPKAMTPTIISDVADRQLKQAWDRLSIVSNCCQYSVRLDSIDLRNKGHSLSLPMLALYLLNGEILSNYPDDEIDPSLNIVKFLKVQSFEGFYPPFSKRGLSFNKSCRFADVQLVEEGIQTIGHLWRLDTLIHTKALSSALPYEPASEYGLKLEPRRQLRRLIDELSNYHCDFLCERLDQFLADDYKADGETTFAKGWLDLMVINLLAAIDEGKLLCTASLIHDHQPAQYSGGIFILEDYRPPSSREMTNDVDFTDSEESNKKEKALETVTSSHSSNSRAGGGKVDYRNFEEPVYVFTSSQPRQEESDTAYHNDIDRYVSMEVDVSDMRGKNTPSRMPYLFTKRWIHGLYFFEGCPRQKVIFPWPASLHEL
ncbi:hypothetical protein F5884DRAFT_824072 [Xylogone sp. PMI_703]|nr:hypothetical protein F5884DRAFT_824072 [Xylogone sp. PMI_703]